MSAAQIRWMIRGAIVGCTAALLVAQGQAQAQAAKRICGDRSAIIEKLSDSYDEAQRTIGLAKDGSVIETFASPAGGFTILVTYPGKPTCIIAAGKYFQVLPVVSGDPA